MSPFYTLSFLARVILILAMPLSAYSYEYELAAIEEYDYDGDALGYSVEPGDKTQKKASIDLTFNVASFAGDGTVDGQNFSLGSMNSIDMGIRHFRIVSILLGIGIPADSAAPDALQIKDSFSFGLRVDIPGNFWLKANPDMLLRTAKADINLAGYVKYNMTTVDREQGVLTMFHQESGLVLDWFLANDYVYLSSSVGVSSLGGNSFITYKYGLGVEF